MKILSFDAYGIANPDVLFLFIAMAVSGLIAILYLYRQYKKMK